MQRFAAINEHSSLGVAVVGVLVAVVRVVDVAAS